MKDNQNMSSQSESEQSSTAENMQMHRGMTRSPPESPRSSFGPGMPTAAQGAGMRRYSLNLPPAVIERLEKRRASLEKLQVDKVSPWMHLYDFTEDKEAPNENDAEEN